MLRIANLIVGCFLLATLVGCGGGDSGTGGTDTNSQAGGGSSTAVTDETTVPVPDVTLPAGGSTKIEGGPGEGGDFDLPPNLDTEGPAATADTPASGESSFSLPPAE